MSYYAIGIGGTGAKCLESVIHLSAAGLIPGDEDLNILFVDPDGANGSLARASGLLTNYRGARDGRVTGTDFLKTDVRPLKAESAPDGNAEVWSPLENGKYQLDNFFNSNLLSEEAGHLLNILYSPDEQKTNLEVGFRGRPAIGAAVMASAIDLDKSEPWRSIKNKMRAEVSDAKPVKVVLFGSIFGGTGASGFPTIGRILKNWVEEFPQAARDSVSVGGVLLLPYFSFAPVEGEGVAASSEDFMLNTQAALQYYSQQDDLDVFDATYLLGSENRLRMRQAQIGGKLQENDPHFVELYAALGAVDFLSPVAGGSANGDRYNMIARARDGAISWTDLPGDATELHRKLIQLTRFSYAFLSQYYPALESIATTGRGYRAPWYLHFFEFRGVALRDALDDHLKEVKAYCESFLLWLARLEYSVAGKQSTVSNLVNISSFTNVQHDQNGIGNIELRTSFDSQSFGDIVLPDEKNNTSLGLAPLWENMSGVRSKGNSENGTWHFLNELYRQCGL